MKTDNRRVLVGAVVLAAGFVLISTLLHGRPGEEARGYRLEAIYRDVTGLRPGAEIVVAGLEVGHVSSLEYVQKNRNVRVTMHIDSGVLIPFDSVPLIVTAGLLGSKYVRIEPGASEEFLEPGDHFELVQDSILIEEILELIASGDAEEK